LTLVLTQVQCQWADLDHKALYPLIDSKELKKQ